MNRYRLLVTTPFVMAAVVGAWAQETTNPHFDEDLSGWSTMNSPKHEWSAVYQYPGKTLYDGEFWDLGSVEWPGGTVTVVDSVTVGVP